MTAPSGVVRFAERYTSAWCSQNPESVAGFFADDGSLSVNAGAAAVGRVAIAEVARGFMTAFPDLVVALDEVSVVGERVRYGWTLSGTYAANGRPVRVSGFELWRFHDDGLIAESQGQFDAEEYQRQIS